MKKLALMVLTVVMYPISMVAQNDVYYIPSKKVKELHISTNQSQVSNDVATTSSSYDEGTPIGSTSAYSVSRDVDEYNRRGGAAVGADQEEALVDERRAQQANEEYDEYSCSKMILRFHSPTGVVVSSPVYWDLCYNGNVLDVYVDSWAVGLPCWGWYSYAYDPWYYNRWWYRTCWDYTWGWYDPWWGASYWGWHRPIYWGWYRPVYGGWGGFAYHHTPYWGGHRYAPGFSHGGRHSYAGGGQIGHGPEGGFTRFGGRNNRSTPQNGGFRNAGGHSRSFSSNHGNLSKSFRLGDGNMAGRHGAFSNESTRGFNSDTRGGYRSSNSNGGGFSSNRQNGAFSSNGNSGARSYKRSDVQQSRPQVNSENRSNRSSSRSGSFNSNSSNNRSGGFSSSSGRSSGGFSSGGHSGFGGGSHGGFSSGGHGGFGSGGHGGGHGGFGGGHGGRR